MSSYAEQLIYHFEQVNRQLKALESLLSLMVLEELQKAAYSKADVMRRCDNK
jgi:hypothetical protein